MMLRSSIKTILLNLGLYKSPMDRLISSIENRGVNLSVLSGIELFARDGSWSTDAMAKKLKSIDLVEIDESYKKVLKGKYQSSNIYIDDSYSFIKNHDKKYDVILSDNPASEHGGHFQHFSLFPHVFNILKDKSLLILNVVDNYGLIHYNPNEVAEHTALKQFYKTDDIKINIDNMLSAYKKIADDSMFEIYDHIKIRRNKAISYLCLFIRKKNI